MGKLAPSPTPDPPPPSASDVAEMRRHMRVQHRRGFDLCRDVSFAGNLSKSAPLTYTAATAGGPAAYHCRDCPGSRFLLGDPFAGTPERRDHLRLVDPKLKPLLAATRPEDQDALIDLYEQRALGSALVAGTVRREGQRTAKHRPETRQRIENCQRYLLERRFAGRTIEQAIDDLIALRETDPRRYREIVGSGRAYSPETFRGYWKELGARDKVLAQHAYDRAHGQAAQ